MDVKKYYDAEHKINQEKVRPLVEWWCARSEVKNQVVIVDETYLTVISPRMNRIKKDYEKVAVDFH